MPTVNIDRVEFFKRLGKEYGQSRLLRPWHPFLGQQTAHWSSQLTPVRPP
jgi:hypothetical protein